MNKILHDNYILQSILYFGKWVHMQVSIASGIYEGFYNLTFYRLLANGSIPKIPACIEDMETIAIQFNVQAETRYFLCKSFVKWVLNLAIKIHIYTVRPSIFFMGESKLWNRAICERNNLLCKQNCGTQSLWMDQVHFKS